MNFKKNQKSLPVGSPCQIKVNKPGFTLIEIIIAVFIFSVLMIALSSIFSSFMGGYRVVRTTQKNLEDAQFIMNQMEKILRTSGIGDAVSDPTAEIKVYNYSLDRCYRYKFENDKIRIWFIDAEDNNSTLDESDPVVWCSSRGPVVGSSTNDYKDIAAFNVKGRFLTTPSAEGVLGKVTMVFELCQDSSCAIKDRIRIQSSVSLRDYYKAGI